eukprot:8395399-Lingulodinium_polyedra.AAC.1
MWPLSWHRQEAWARLQSSGISHCWRQPLPAMSSTREGLHGGQMNCIRGWGTWRWPGRTTRK